MSPMHQPPPELRPQPGAGSGHRSGNSSGAPARHRTGTGTGAPANLRHRHRHRTPARMATNALLALTLVASTLITVALAVAAPVALSDPTPAAAQSNTTTLRIVEVTTLTNPSDQNSVNYVGESGVTYEITPDCTGVSPAPTPTPTKQTQTDGAAATDDYHGRIHTLDKRCDWAVAFTQSSSCPVKFRAARVINNPVNTTTDLINSVTLKKDSDSNNYLEVGSDDFETNVLRVLVDRSSGGCTDTELSIDVADSNDSPTDAGLSYTLTPSDCRAGVTAPATQSATDGTVSTTANKVSTHDVDWLCDWTIAAPNTSNPDCPVNLLLYNGDTILTGMDGTATSSVKLFKNPNRGDPTTPVYTLSQASATSKPVTRIELSPGGCDVEILVRDRQGILSVDDLGVTYSLIPRNCTGDAPSTQTQLNPTHPTAQPSNVVDMSSNQHMLTSRCDWEVRYSGPSGRCVVMKLRYRASLNVSGDPTGSATHTFMLTKDTANSQLKFRDQPTNRLDLETFPHLADANDSNSERRCVTTLNVRNRQGVQAADVTLQVRPMKDSQPCTPNSNSTGVRGAQSITENRNNEWDTYLLGHNCNWIITFGSANPNCTATAKFYNANGNLVKVDVQDTNGHNYLAEFKVVAHPGDTATFRLTGMTDHLQFRPVHDVTAKISAVEFIGCDVPPNSNGIVINEQTLGVPYQYELEAVLCGGIGLPAKQTRATGLVSESGTSITHNLANVCDWKLSFTTDNNCEVKATINFAGDADADDIVVTKGFLYLDGDLTFTDQQKTDGRFRARDRVLDKRFQSDPGNGETDAGTTHTKAIKSIDITTDGTGDKCTFDLNMTNVSPALGNQNVLISSSSAAGTCGTDDGPHDWGKGLDVNLILEPSESFTEQLALNCDWTYIFSAVTKNCSATAQVKDTDGNPLGAVVVQGLAGVAILTLNKSNAGLTYPSAGATPTPTLVGSVEFNACAGEVTSPPENTTKITVENTTPTAGFNYSFTKTNCASEAAGFHPNSPVGLAEAAVFEATVSGSTTISYVQYLDYRCDWDFALSEADCPVAFKVEDAAGTELATPSGATTKLSKDTNPNGNQLLVGTDTAKVIDTLSVEFDASDASCVTFVNVQRTRGFSADNAPRPPVTDERAPQVLLLLTPKTAGGEAACTADANYAGPSEGEATLLAATVRLHPAGSGTKAGFPVEDSRGNLVLDPDPQSHPLDKTCDWLVEFAPGDGACLPSEGEDCIPSADATCLASAQVRGTDGTAIGKALLGVPVQGGVRCG